MTNKKKLIAAGGQQKIIPEIHSHSQQQLAFDIFTSFNPTGLPISDAKREISFEKPHLLVDVSGLGVVARQALNACYFIAQADPWAEQHVVDARFYRWLTKYDSRNTTHLKKTLRDAQKSSVQVNIIDAKDVNNDQWMSVQMLGDVGVKDGKIIFEIPKRLRPALADPDRRSLLSMRVQADFTTSYALDLYEHLSAYRDVGHSPLWSVDDIRNKIGADNVRAAEEFRYFNRDILRPAIQQINDVSDIEVTVHLIRTGRYITHLNFNIRQSERYKGAFNISTSKELFDILTSEFGLSDDELVEIAENRETWNEERITIAIEFVRDRVAKENIRYPAKYLMTAIRKGFRLSGIEQKERKSKEEANQRGLNLKRIQDEANWSALKVELPTGSDLETAWVAFLTHPAYKVFKKSATFEEATSQQRASFTGFLAEHWKKTGSVALKSELIETGYPVASA